MRTTCAFHYYNLSLHVDACIVVDQLYLEKKNGAERNYVHMQI